MYEVEVLVMLLTGTNIISLVSSKHAHSSITPPMESQYPNKPIQPLNQQNLPIGGGANEFEHPMVPAQELMPGLSERRHDWPQPAAAASGNSSRRHHHKKRRTSASSAQTPVTITPMSPETVSIYLPVQRKRLGEMNVFSSTLPTSGRPAEASPFNLVSPSPEANDIKNPWLRSGHSASPVDQPISEKNKNDEEKQKKLLRLAKFINKNRALIREFISSKRAANKMTKPRQQQSRGGVELSRTGGGEVTVKVVSQQHGGGGDGFRAGAGLTTVTTGSPRHAAGQTSQTRREGATTVTKHKRHRSRSGFEKRTTGADFTMRMERARSSPASANVLQLGRPRELRGVWGEVAREMRTTPITGNMLDLAPAKGNKIEHMRYKGRICQRHVLIPEGPKYDSRGLTYWPEYVSKPNKPDFAATKPREFLLPACCNCCRKSVLGCS